MFQHLFYKQDAESRKHQINTLKIFNDKVIEIKEDSEYEVHFQAGDNNLVLTVSLGSDFPKEKPVLVISPSVVHPWVNDHGVVTSAPGLLNFTVHSDLGRVVQAIIRELQRNPPPLVENNTAATHSSNTADEEQQVASGFPSKYQFSPPPQLLQDSQIKASNMGLHSSAAFPELNQLTLDELRFLATNEDRQDEFLNELPAYKEQHRIMDELISQIEELADNNLNREEQLVGLQEAVDLRIEEAAKLAFENERLYTQYQNLAEKFSPRSIQVELGKAAKNAEEETEKLVESFLHGDLDVDKFLNLFIKTKAVCQLRKTKEEKLRHQLDWLQSSGFVF